MASNAGAQVAFAEGRSGTILAEARVLNLTPPSKIGSGICFFDHMLDQLTSHAQLGVTMRCGVYDKDSPQPRAEKDCFAPLKDYATGLSSRAHDQDIFVACGTALGLALKRVVDEVASQAAAAAPPSSAAMGSAVFCSPLDESFTEASLKLRPPPERAGRCETCLEPYGSFGGETGSGRKWVGRYRTDLTPAFWKALAVGLGCDLRIVKVRGGNAHHQLESAFKAFARAFRAALDNLADGGAHGCAAAGAPPVALGASPTLSRCAERKRATKETTIEVRVDLDAPYSKDDEKVGAATAWDGETKTPTKLQATVQAMARVKTGIPVLDEVLEAFAQAAGVELVVHCEGDRHIDDHHTAEDVAITLGQCLHEAFGDKAGFARMGCAEGEPPLPPHQDDSGASHAKPATKPVRVRAVLDLSNRPHFESDLPLDEEYVGGAAMLDETGEGPSPWDSLCGAVLSTEMLFHVFNSLTLEMRCTCHLEVLEDTKAEGHTRDLALAAASAYGAALSRAIRLDPRRRGAVASSKGTLSK
jgi:imidazoleglycerol-phosphate dehydratase